MLNPFGRGLIARKLLERLASRVGPAQQKYEAGAKGLETDSVKTVAAIYKQLESDKEALADKLVLDILNGK